MPPRIEVLTKEEYEKWWEKRIVQAQRTRGVARIPLTAPLPGGKLLVVKSSSIGKIFDTDIDVYR